MKVAFYAPMKSPDHPTPSGDRRMARLFMAALEGAGCTVTLASSFRAYDKSGEASFQEKIRTEALVEAQKLVAGYEALEISERPKAWFTYHVYHKAPDWIGPYVSKALDIPYLIAEASHAPKQKQGRWASGYKAAADAISEAKRVFHMTKLDGECLSLAVSSPASLVYLPPFIEGATVNTSRVQKASGSTDLLCVAMMRDGDKFQSFQQLAEALPHLTGNWRLLIAGDGDKRSAIEDLFSDFDDKIVYLGRLDEDELTKIYAQAHIYVWPAHGEAFGMAFLEAARAGLPVVAGNLRGVPDVVIHGKTGLLAPAGDMVAFANCIQKLMDDPDMAVKMGSEGRRFVREERSLEATSILLKVHLEEVMS
ncbi:MAG: glycosyltransferase family 4 protein [Sneathiella sp.]